MNAKRPINAVQLLLDAEIRLVIIDEYRAALRDLMINRISVMGGDEAFQTLARELAERLGCELMEAGMLLHPIAYAICKAAETAHA